MLYAQQVNPDLLHPAATPKRSYLEQCFDGAKGPAIASTDWVRAHADQIRPYLRMPYYVLGTEVAPSSRLSALPGNAAFINDSPIRNAW